MKRLITVVFCIIMLTLPAASISQELLEGVAVIVGDEIILHSEVNQFASQLAIQSKIDVQKEPEKLAELRKMSLESLIVQKILLVKAREDTVTVNEARVEEVLTSQVDNWAQQLGSESKIEEYFGIPISKIKRQFREEVRNRLMVETVQGMYVQKINITRPEVENFYNTMGDSLPDVKNMVKISHILVEIRAGGKGRDDALKKLADIRQKIVDGEDFGSLAEQHSEDPGSARRKGELGFIQRGDFVREFEEVAFSLKEDQLSDIVETKFGFHVIQLIERRGERINVRHILIQLQPTGDDADVTREFLMAVRDSVILGSDFNEMAIRHSEDPTLAENDGDLGWFEVEQLKLPEFKTALDSLEVGEISLPFRSQYGFHVVKLDEKRDSGKLTLDKDWQQIEQWALSQKQGRMVQEWIADLRQHVYIEIKEEKL